MTRKHRRLLWIGAGTTVAMLGLATAWPIVGITVGIILSLSVLRGRARRAPPGRRSDEGRLDAQTW